MKSAAFMKQARELLGLDPTEFAKRLGVGWRSIYRYETGSVVPEPVERLTIRLLHEHGHNIGKIERSSPTKKRKAK
jgi:DNA-binding transcriptional regulator YiaG